MTDCPPGYAHCRYGWAVSGAGVVYRLGIDVGSAYVSAAVMRDGRLEVLPLGGQDARMPAVLFVRPDGEFLAGRAAQRRSLAEPARAARDFVRRLGDPTPLLIAGVPYPPQALIAHLLGLVAETAARRFGGPPEAVTLTYPACWSPYKADLLLGALRQADFDGAPDLEVISAPVAVAAQHAHRTGASAEDLVAVYDLGAGSFDAAVVGGRGPTLLGTATGMEQFGGFDLDEALLAHVLAAAGVPDGTGSATGITDPGRLAWRSRLRAECAEAKELLSEDSETEVSVDTGGGSEQVVTVTREQFERIIRPALVATVKGLRRALRSVPVEASELDGVLLHGGCARIPLVQQLLAEELGPNVSFDLRPPEEIALGAALLAAGFPALGVDADDVVPMQTVVIGAPLATSLPPSDPHLSQPGMRSYPPVTPVPGAVGGSSDVAAFEDATALGAGVGSKADLDPDTEYNPVPAAVGASAGGAGGGGGNRSHRAGGGVGGFVRRRPWVPVAAAAVLIPAVVLGILLPSSGGGGGGGASTGQTLQSAKEAADQRQIEAAEALPAAAAATPTPSATTAAPSAVPVANRVLAGGSVEVAPITETAYALYRQKSDDVSVSVDAVNTDDGYARLCKGQVDLSGASYALDPTPGCGEQQVVGFEVAHETLPVVVDTSNTWAKCLTLGQLHKIFGNESPATSWNQVDPSFPDVPLSVYGPDQSSVPYAFFNASVNGSRDGGRNDYAGHGDGAATARGVASAKGAVGYLDFPSLAANTDRLRGVEINSGSGCVYPTLTAAQNGKYLPLCKPLFIYVNRASLKKPAVAAFLNFYLANGETIAEDAHYVPRDDAEIADATGKIKELTKGVKPVAQS